MADLMGRLQRLPVEPDAGLADARRQLGLVLAALTAAAVPADGEPGVPTSAEGAITEERPRTVTLDEMSPLISVSTAATVLGVSRASAYRYAANGDLPTVRLGGRLYVVTARLKALLAAA